MNTEQNMLHQIDPYVRTQYRGIYMTQNAMSHGGSEKEEITLKTGQKALTLIVLG